jgi:hypothetical protein
METDELIASMHRLNLMLAGRVAALACVNEALLTTLVMAFPPLADDLTQHLDALAAFVRPDQEEEGLPVFDGTLDKFHEAIRMAEGG